jgi:hypothetical protein
MTTATIESAVVSCCTIGGDEARIEGTSLGCKTCPSLGSSRNTSCKAGDSSPSIRRSVSLAHRSLAS